MESGLYVVSTPIGNLEDISLRAIETLRHADVVLAEDTRRTGRLLSHLGIRVRLRSLHAHNEAERVTEVLDRLSRGERCALVSDAGTPAVSDPGRRVVEAALRAGYRVIPIPGPSAVLAALAASGQPADRFLFLGFAPRRGAERQAWLQEIGTARWTTVVFESPKRIGNLLQDLVEHGLGDRPAALARELTKLHEEIRHGTISDLLRALETEEPRGEVTLVVGGDPCPRESVGSGEEAWASAAKEWSEAGCSAREIAARLRSRFGLSRNRAYEMSLKAAGRAPAGGRRTRDRRPGSEGSLPDA